MLKTNSLNQHMQQNTVLTELYSLDAHLDMKTVSRDNVSGWMEKPFMDMYGPFQIMFETVQGG